MSNLQSAGPKMPRSPSVSTFVVGGLALLFIAAGAATKGIGGALIFLAIFALLTGLYVVATGRRSWAWIPGGRKIGAAVVGASLILFVVGGALWPSPSQSELDASAASKNQNAHTTGASSATAGVAPAATPTPTETGSPLDPDRVTEPAKDASFAAPGSQPTYATKALDLLATLQVKGRAPKTGYDRAMFGQSWADVDRNGCDTRNDILKRDLTQITYTNSVPCKIQSGILADPYTGTSINFLRGSTTSTAVQIDHVVALSDAWQKGAQQLSTEQRTAFANDPANLQATDGPTNIKKGDGDAATWLPPNKSFRCEYVARQISVKATYKLWVTQAEHDAMASILGGCAGQLVPTNQKVPATPEPVQPPAPAPVTRAPAAAYYSNCDAARAAGVAPIRAGQPGYRAGLDRDGDGIACDK